MKINIDHLLYILLFCVFFGRIIYRVFCIRKMMKNEMIKGNAMPLNHSWNIKIKPVFKDAWRERKKIMKEIKNILFKKSKKK